MKLASKRNLTVFALILSLVLSVPALAAPDGSVLKSDIFSYTVSGGNATITGVDDRIGTVVVPEVIDNYTVTAIGDGAFGGSASITEIHIPNSVTSIGSMCFAYSSSIRTVYLPSTITTVPNGAFYQCSSLSNVSMPYGIEAIDAIAFAQCPNLTAVNIPNSMKSIADDAFSDSPNVRFYCYCSDGAVGYSYAQARNIDCEELITVYVNDTEVAFDQPPITDKKQFRTLVPVRAVVESMGAKIVEWYEDMSYAGINIGEHRILVKPGSDFMMVNGKAVTLDSPAIQYNFRLMLPIRSIVEAVGGEIKWDEFSKTIRITYSEEK